MVVLTVLVYLNGLRSIETQVHDGVESDASIIVREIETTLRERELAFSSLASSQAIVDYLRENNKDNAASNTTEVNKRDATVINGTPEYPIPDDLREAVRLFLYSNPKSLGALTCIGATGLPLFRAELVAGHGVNPDTSNAREILVKTQDIVANSVNADARVWSATEQSTLRSPISIEANGARLRYTIPIFLNETGAMAKRGVLVVEMDADALLESADYDPSDATGPLTQSSQAGGPKKFIVIIDRQGTILYHSNEALRHQPAAAVMSSFKYISNSMQVGERGWGYYEADNLRWLGVYRPIASLGASIGVLENYSTATQSVRRQGLITAVLLAFFGLATVLVLAHILKNTARSIERVTEGAVAIAGGQLDQRIEVRSNDETRVLAESFNIMTDRLREQIARETESRQFESFVRLSAMLTHDLKNAIAGLSLLVGNMERQFHREEFRADAMSSLTEATDKLKRLVSKLSEPVQSLSSEHKLARPTDLVTIFNRVLATTVNPPHTMHEIDVQLPSSLVATVESDRIEKVFENLIINAIEAMGAKRGKLSIKAGPSGDAEVYFSVSDNGPGMSEEFQRTRLFRAFATTKKSGVGLGLYTCREIVQAHGGRIDVESRRGSGATFRVVLPSVPMIMKDK